MSAGVDRIATYRRMTEADLEVVVSIERAIHAHPWTPGNFKDSLAAGYECWIAERDRQIVGHGVVLMAADEAHLLNLSIAAEWQRHGIGSDFARFFMKLARDCGATKIYLEVRPSNGAARALYANLGFAEAGTRRDYYPACDGREDAVIMELGLQ